MTAGVQTIRSFDVFDTVLTRTVGAPTAVVDLLAEELAIGGSIPVSSSSFSHARRNYEHRMNHLLGRPAKLEEIYAAMADAFSVHKSEGVRWAALEESMERRLCVPLPGALELVEAARVGGQRVIFVSDTPHREALVRGLLEATGIAKPGDEVFTSAERGCSKAEGGLYRSVAVELGGGSFLHTGDNHRVDVAAARLEGWGATHRPIGQLTRYEAALGAKSSAPVGNWLAGASRLARSAAIERGTKPAIAEVAAGVLAPTLVAYALWLGGHARLHGIRRLYFVSRDGQLMMRVAEPVLRRVAPEIECRYLYGSRQAWMFAGSAESDEVLRQWVSVRSDFTLRTALSRVGLDPEDIDLPFATPGRADEPLTVAQRRELAEALMSSPLIEQVRAAAQETARATVAYLNQEGLMEGTPAALVDAGWTGGTARALDRVLKSVGASSLPQFVIGLFRTSGTVRGDSGPRLIPWLFDEAAHPAALTNLHGPNVLIEMFCSGEEGRLVGYNERPDGHVVPVLAERSNTPVIEWGLREMQAIAVEAAEFTVPQLAEADLHTDLTQAVWKVLEMFWSSPTKAEVAAWGSFPWEEEIWPPFNPVAQAISTGDVLRRARRGDTGLRRNNSWRAGSAIASPQPWRTILQARSWQLRNAPRLARLPRRVLLEIARRR